MSEKNELKLKDLWPLIEEKINSGAKVTINPGGISMLPLVLAGRDSVVLEKVPGKLKKYDVVLYKRRSGMFVLHRIVGIKDGKYVMCGDNEYVREYGIEHDAIRAYMTMVIRKKKEISIKSFKYKLYSMIRVKYQHIKWIIKRIKRKIFG